MYVYICMCMYVYICVCVCACIICFFSLQFSLNASNFPYFILLHDFFILFFSDGSLTNGTGVRRPAEEANREDKSPVNRSTPSTRRGKSSAVSASTCRNQPRNVAAITTSVRHLGMLASGPRLARFCCCSWFLICYGIGAHQ